MPGSAISNAKKDLSKYNTTYDSDSDLQGSVTANATYYKTSINLSWYKLVDEDADQWEKVTQIVYTAPKQNETIQYKAVFKLDGVEMEVFIDATMIAKVDSETKVISMSDVASANGWKDATKYTSFSIDSEITISLSNTGTNSGKYYTNGSNWRLYQTESPILTITSTHTIVSVTIEYTSDKNGCLVVDGNNITSGSPVQVNNTSIVYSVGNTGSETKGQARITKITIKYIPA